MKIGDIIKANQPGIHNQLNRKQGKAADVKKRYKERESLSFSDIEKLMQHDSYTRGKGGAIRQVRYK